MLEMRITDEGTGISEENLNKIFRIDSDYHAVGTAQEKGAGIGLLLCKDYIEKNGGKIWAESEIGKGSSFFFYLTSKQQIDECYSEISLIFDI